MIDEVAGFPIGACARAHAPDRARNAQFEYINAKVAAPLRVKTHTAPTPESVIGPPHDGGVAA